jgi:hypothetical protein
VAVAQDPNAADANAFVSFIDARDPSSPVFVSQLTLDGAHQETPMTGLSCAALTRLDDGHYLLMAYRYSESHPGIGRALLFRTTTPFLNANSDWSRVSELTIGHGLPGDWYESIENIAFLSQRDGALFLATLTGKFTDNHVRVYRLSDQADALTFCTEKFVRTLPGRGTLRAGGGLHVTPSGELVLYAVQQAGGSQIRDMMIEEFSV